MTFSNLEIQTDSGRATGKVVMAPPLQFPKQTNKQRPNSFSFKHQGYSFLCVFRNYTDQKFQDFYRLCSNF